MRRFTPVPLLALLALAGCGGGGGDSSSAPAASAPAPAATTAAPQTVPTGASRPQPQEGTVVGLARDIGDLTTFYAALLKAGAVDELSGPGPFTVFMPTNVALAKDGVDGIEQLLGSPKLKQVLLGHVVPGRVTPSDGQVLKTLAGTSLHVESDRVGSAKLANPKPFVAGNGIVYELDGLAVEP